MTLRHRITTVLVILAVAAIAATVLLDPSTRTRPASTAKVAAVSPLSAGAAAPGPSKVMVIAEENEEESAVIGSSEAPYLTRLAATYGQATDMQAGYPTECPSLAAYIIITSGDRAGICDDKNPSAHRLSQDNIFAQVAKAGLQWRQYSESMTTNCQAKNGGVGGYLVRHAPPPYYTSEAKRCPLWDVPLGTTSTGALHDALSAGLPAYSFVTPNACNDMHGADGCTTGKVRRGDNWLAAWMPKVIASPDFQAGRLLVVITWDEGSKASNHIPTLVVAKGISGVRSSAAYTHCSTLRTTEDVLGLPRLACAASATSFRYAFGF